VPGWLRSLRASPILRMGRLFTGRAESTGSNELDQGPAPARPAIRGYNRVYLGIPPAVQLERLRRQLQEPPQHPNNDPTSHLDANDPMRRTRHG
jgi:hypothetical protein